MGPTLACYFCISILIVCDEHMQLQTGSVLGFADARCRDRCVKGSLSSTREGDGGKMLILRPLMPSSNIM